MAKGIKKAVFGKAEGEVKETSAKKVCCPQMKAAIDVRKAGLTERRE